MRAPIRVLVVEDSPVMAAALTALLEEAPDIQVVGRAADGHQALQLARRLAPDVVTMDLVMPGLAGPEAIEAIMAEAPTRVVVVSHVAEQRNQLLCFQAMEAGALELLAKPFLVDGEQMRRWGVELVRCVRALAGVDVPTRARPRPAPPAPPAGGGAPGPRSARRVDAFGLVASTGGPPALADVLSRLPADLPVPLLVAQHISEGFTGGMARWLAGASRLEVRVARHGERLAGGCVYLPPDGCDLRLEPGGSAGVSRTRGGPCPSGDVLLESLARVQGRRAGGAVLTGMGEDGARGLLAIHHAGGLTLVQDEATSVVFGMPRAALALGAAERALALPALAEALREACRPGPPGGGPGLRPAGAPR